MTGHRFPLLALTSLVPTTAVAALSSTARKSAIDESIADWLTEDRDSIGPGTAHENSGKPATHRQFRIPAVRSLEQHDSLTEPMAANIPVFYGSYRSSRMGIRLAKYVVDEFTKRGDQAELIDAKAIGLPMLDRMYKEYATGTAPPGMEALAEKIRGADAFVFVTGEYNWGMQPGLKNLTDHFLEEWFWRPAGIASYSAGRIAGARSAFIWHGSLSEMGMVVISSTLTVGPIAQALDEHGKPLGEAGAQLERTFPRFAEDLSWWAEAARLQRARRAPPY